jgi:hypothetical protein
VGTSYGKNRYGRNWDGYPNWGGSFQLRQTALNAGYNEGQKQGSNDRSRGRITNNFNNYKAYRNANKDYNSRDGDRVLYQRYFRMAFENGYADGAGTNGAYDNGGYTINDSWRDRDRDRGRGRGRGNRRGRSWDSYPNWGGSFQLRQTALNAGYNEGHKEGVNDRNRRRSSDYNRFDSYRDADKDYDSRYGDEELYRRYFREAFQTGYSDGYDGY